MTDVPLDDRLAALDTEGGEPAAGTTIGDVHDVFRRWLGDEYDLGALNTVLAAAAVEQLDGDPVWLLIISGSGNAKTETVCALAGAGATVTSTITSEGALLSATSAKERTKDATGGLLRKLGARGTLVIKDFTSIISMNRDLRKTVLGALREVYDGMWERNVGTDGARSIRWQGRLIFIGATTTAYDQAHGVIAEMGDRFAVVRMDSTVGRTAAGRQALKNVGHEIQMRSELAAAAGRILAGLDPGLATLGDDDMETLLFAADLVTLARTAVEKDYRGDPIEAHAPEMPTRFAKQLGQVMRGALALHIDRDTALAIALRVARDSVPPRRAALLKDIAEHPGSHLSDVVKRIQQPKTTTDRALQELHLIGLFTIAEDPGYGWQYRLNPKIADSALIKALFVPGDLGSQRCEYPLPEDDAAVAGAAGIFQQSGLT